jgi:hypothetical protein
MNYQDLFYLTSTIATIIVSLIGLIFFIKKISLNKRFYKIETYEWENIIRGISSAEYRFERIQKDIEHIRENLKIEKLKDENE